MRRFAKAGKPDRPGLPTEAGKRGSCRTFFDDDVENIQEKSRPGARSLDFPRFFRPRTPGNPENTRENPTQMSRSGHGPAGPSRFEPHQEPTGRRDHRHGETRAGERLGAPLRLGEVVE